MTGRTLRAVRRVGMPAVAVLAVGILLGAWALSIILTPPAASAGPAGFSTVEVVAGEVGSQLALNVAAEWAPTPVGTNQAAGIVTGVDATSGAEVGQGARLYAVDGRPVVVARGDTPAYRALGPGAAGDDVRQLQQLLVDLGLLAGPGGGTVDDATVDDATIDDATIDDATFDDGTLDDATVEAVHRWQESLGAPATGEVAFGDIIFVPALPARLTLRDDIVKRGARLAGGEEVVLALGASPIFTLPAGDAQSSQIPTGARVAITAPSGAAWSATVTGRVAAPTGSTVVLGLAPTAAAPPICGDDCDSIPVAGQTLLSASVVTVETVRGAVVPTIALQTDGRQHLSLVDTEGNGHPVTVEAEANGMSVVSGVDVGIVVRIPEISVTLDGASAAAAGGAAATPSRLAPVARFALAQAPSTDAPPGGAQ